MKNLLNTLVPYEPKKKNRWCVSLPNDFDIAKWAIFETSRPTISIDDSGKLIYNTIDIYFYDLIGPSTSQRLFMLTEAYKYKETPWYKKIFNKLLGKKNNKPHYMFEKYLPYINGFDYDLELLDPTGVTVEKWLIKGCKIVNIDFGELNYEDEGITIIKATIQPKDFTLLF